MQTSSAVSTIGSDVRQFGFQLLEELLQIALVQFFRVRNIALECKSLCKGTVHKLFNPIFGLFYPPLPSRNLCVIPELPQNNPPLML